MSSTPKFYDNLQRLPRYDGWYWWRPDILSQARRYYLQFNGKWATPQDGGGTVPTAMLGGEWGDAAPDPEEHL